MPRVKIDTPGVTVELDANETSMSELGKQAMDMFREACEIHRGDPTGPALGYSQDKRWTPDHQDVSGGYGGAGFKPVKA